MNTEIQVDTLDQATTFDPIAFWNLDDKSRFPIGLQEWATVGQLPNCPHPKTVGDHAYAIVINRKARRPIVNTMRRLLAAFPGDFSLASDVFQPDQWRLLHYLDQYPLSALSAPSFDAMQAFRAIYEQKSSDADVPQPWTGSSETSLDMLWDLRAYRYDIKPDVAKAAWAILAFARSLGLEKNEILRLPWWQVWWINRCIAAYR